MQNFEDIFETREQSFISAFSIYITVLLNKIGVGLFRHFTKAFVSSERDHVALWLTSDL